MTKLNSFTGHHALEKGKYAEIRKFINLWLQEPNIYCANCGMPYFPGEIACCDVPMVGKNIQHLQALLLEIDARRKIRLNDFSSNSAKTMRLGLSMPPDLIRKLERFCQERFGEKLFVNQKDFRGFCKAFPMFTIMEKI
jgi:hypothetical protein